MKILAVYILLCCVFLPAGAARAGTATWSGAGVNSNWFDTNNWYGTVLPGAADDVFVTNGAGGPILTGSVAVLTLTVSNKTLTFQGTNTVLTASNITVAGASGKITHGVNTDTNGVDGWTPDNGIWIQCTNLTVDPGGAAISADSAGYAGGTAYLIDGCGPGKGKAGAGGWGSGGGYGGQGGTISGAAGGVTNGSALFPFDPGSGGGGGSSGTAPSGGGAVRIEAGNRVTVNGSLSANGTTSFNPGGGSGGGIYLRCQTLNGTGTIYAAGGSSGTVGGGGGGGGRIAVYYLVNNFWGLISVAGGTGYTYGATGSVQYVLQPGYLELRISGYPAQHGDSAPYKYGSSGVASNSVVTNSVTTPADETNGVRYACVGWNGTGSVPTSGLTTQVVFTMTNASTLTWLWTNEYWLTTTAGPNGGLASDMSGWYTNGKLVSVTAVASGGYHFVEWSGDVTYGDYSNNPLVLTIDRVKTVQAHFGTNGGGAKRWVGPAGGSWHTPANWSPSGVPGDLDDATVSNGTPVIANPARVFSLLLTNSTLTFYGTNTILAVSNIVVAGTNGRITHAIQTATTNVGGQWFPSNVVWIMCTNFTVASGGAAVNVDGMGYAGGSGYKIDGCGPGRGKAGNGGYGGGAGYGGLAGDATDGSAGGGAYGSEIYPFDPGSGGGGGSSGTAPAGGGAVRIEASGRMTIDGAVSANGTSSYNPGGGSGGGIYIRCHTLSGTGTISAAGGTSTGNGGGGGGGRIAVHFDETESCAIQFGASDGDGYRRGRPGTLALSRFDGMLANIWTNRLTLATNALSPNWSPDSLTVSGTLALAVFQTGFVLNVTGQVQVLGGARVELGENAALSCSNVAMSGSTLQLTNRALCDLKGGDLVLTNSAAVYLYMGAGFTNADEVSLVGVSTMYPSCHLTSGVPPLPFVVRNFLVASNSQVNANGGGYAGGEGWTYDGYGPGRGKAGASGWGAGAGYGGQGGNGNGIGATGGTNYGSLMYPFDPGSGGGGGSSGVNPLGGGAVRIEASGRVTINGTVSANGTSSFNPGGGAGGGIYIRCNTLEGMGALSAAGGSGGAGGAGGGGGGRIAIYCTYNHYYGTLSVTNGTGWANGTAGTIYWRIQGPGTMFYVR